MVQIFTVEKFLCCFKLEVCAYLFAFVGLIALTSMHIAVISLGIFALLNFEYADELISDLGFHFDGIIGQVLKLYLSSRTGELQPAGENDSLKIELLCRICLIFFAALIVVSLLVAVHLIVVIRLHVMLVIGIKRRIPDHLKPFLYITAIGTLVGSLAISSFDFLSIVIALISSAFHLYIFICLYSLYKRFKKEQNYKFPQ